MSTNKPASRFRDEQNGKTPNQQTTEMIMKTLILTTTLVASILASALTVQAADRRMSFDGAKFFDDIANRSGQ